MSASWSRPISSPKSIRAITSANRKKHGRRRAHGLAGAQGMAPRGLPRLHPPFDAGTGVRPPISAALDGELPAVLSPAVLPHSGIAGAPDRASDRNPSGVVCRQPHLL